MKSLFEEPLPFSDYVILYFVDMFGVDWMNFYYILLVIIFGITIGGWVTAFYIYTKCNHEIYKATQEKRKK
jgi:hypothetical protein